MNQPMVIPLIMKIIIGVDAMAGISDQKVEVGRPRITVDFAIVLRMRDVEKMGWSRMAQAYRELTGQFISRDTIKRRYLEASKKKH
jgi:hypothetical protein